MTWTNDNLHRHLNQLLLLISYPLIIFCGLFIVERNSPIKRRYASLDYCHHNGADLSNCRYHLHTQAYDSTHLLAQKYRSACVGEQSLEFFRWFRHDWHFILRLIRCDTMPTTSSPCMTYRVAFEGRSIETPAVRWNYWGCWCRSPLGLASSPEMYSCEDVSVYAVSAPAGRRPTCRHYIHDGAKPKMRLILNHTRTEPSVKCVLCRTRRFHLCLGLRNNVRGRTHMCGIHSWVKWLVQTNSRRSSIYLPTARRSRRGASGTTVAAWLTGLRNKNNEWETPGILLFKAQFLPAPFSCPRLFISIHDDSRRDWCEAWWRTHRNVI